MWSSWVQMLWYSSASLAKRCVLEFRSCAMSLINIKNERDKYTAVEDSTGEAAWVPLCPVDDYSLIIANQPVTNPSSRVVLNSTVEEIVHQSTTWHFIKDLSLLTSFQSFSVYSLSFFRPHLLAFLSTYCLHQIFPLKAGAMLGRLKWVW